MIVYTNTFALAESNLDRPQIGYHTYTRGGNASVTVSGETIDGPKDAVLRPETHEAWVPPSVPATCKVDFGAAQQVDYVALGGHTLGSAGSTVLVETSLDDATYTTFAAGLVPANDAAIIFRDTQRSARFVRVTVTGAVARIAVIYAGLILKMMKSVQGGYAPITMSRQSELQFAMSRGGQFLGSAFRRHGIAGNIAFSNLAAAWVRASFDPFIKSAREYPYFLAWNPLEFPLESGYVWTDKDIVPRYNGLLDLMDVSWDMVGKGNV